MTTTTASAPPLSPDQQAAHDAILAWFKDRKPLLTLGGLAGSGKTTLMGAVTRTLRAQRKGLRVAFVCFTGKASSVLRAKLFSAGVLNNDYCGTIHGLIYKPRLDAKGRILGWERAPALEADLIVVDEASMLDEVLFKDLQSYGVPILAVGDHGQLPPISGSLNLMGNPDIKLEKIHRQAEGNPIIRAAMMARNGEKLLVGTDWDGRVVKVGDKKILETLDLAQTLVLCGTNRTRTALNLWIRGRLGFKDPEPQPREKVICLKNNRLKGIFNGLTGVIQKITPERDHWFGAEIQMDGAEGVLNARISRHQFGAPATLKGTEIEGLDWKNMGELFDFGNCLTVHKSQGSEAKQVVVFEECDWMRDEDLRRRWLYTAYTRAAERLIVIGR